MDPLLFATSSTFINAVTATLSKIVENITDPVATQGLQEFFQRSYKRKVAEAKLARVIQETVNEFEGVTEYEWLVNFVKNLGERPTLATRIATIAIEMTAPDQDRIPEDILEELKINKTQQALLAKFLFKLRGALAQIEGYAEAISYADRLYDRGILQNIFHQVQVVEGNIENTIEIKSGPAEVVASGTTISFAGNPIEINYGPRIERLTLIFAFQDDATSDTRIEASNPNPNTLRLTLYNFRSPLGIGTNTPVPIGTLVGRPLYIHYRIYDIGNSDKTVQYTIYRREEDGNNG